MARRAASLTKGRTPTGDTAPADAPEPAVATAPRRGKQAKMAPVEEPVTETSVADRGPSEPAKLRRARKPRLIELAAETLAAEDEPTEESDALPLAPAEPIATPSAARWDANTGTATFDWPAIEQVAAASGPNQGMAQLLLAARAEGANSRWPF